MLSSRKHKIEWYIIKLRVDFLCSLFNFSVSPSHTLQSLSYKKYTKQQQLCQMLCWDLLKQTTKHLTIMVILDALKHKKSEEKIS